MNIKPAMIRRIDASDVTRVKQLFRDIERESQPHQPTAPDLAAEGFDCSLKAFDFLSSDSFWFLAAEVEDRLVGYATVVRIPKADARLGALYIDELYVLKVYRRQGVGTAILNEVGRIAEELQFWRIRLNADAGNPAVRQFYESLGFSDNGDGFFERKVTP